MRMDWIIYGVLFILVILLGTYYKKLQQQKIFLEHFNEKYRNNSVLKSYDTYNQSYTNLVKKNNALQNDIVNNKYGSYYDTIYSNFFRLNKDSGKLVPEINRRAGILQTNSNNFKQELAKDASFIDNNKNQIIDKYNKQTDKTFSNLNKPSVKPDENANCAYWAGIGECKKNPGYMLYRCATSCDKIQNNITIIPSGTQNMTAYRGKFGIIYQITVTGSTRGGSVWGTDTYTDDSYIPMAAVHAGLTSNEQTTNVFIEMMNAQSSYSGTSRNGVQTHNYGNWGGTYKFVKPDISIKNIVENLYKKHLVPSVGDYAAGLSNNNKELVDGINNKYNKVLQKTSGFLNGQELSFSQRMEADVKTALDNKKKKLPSQDLSNNPGILVRIYSSATPIKDTNTFGKLTNEYVVPAINYYMTSTLDSFFNNKKLSFEKLDKTNCVFGRIPFPGASGNGYKYLGNFDTYEQCARSANIDSNAKAITIHGNNSGGYSRQCYSINDNNTRVINQADTTCGIISSLGIHRYLEFLGNISIPNDASIIEFKLESAVGSRLYFAGSLIIDDFQPNKSVDRNSSVTYVVGGQKVPFKLQALEGLDNTNSYIILKWRINQKGSYTPIPIEYYFLPNLKPNLKTN